MSLRHFLRLTDLSGAELRQIIKRASELKFMQRQRVPMNCSRTARWR